MTVNRNAAEILLAIAIACLLLGGLVNLYAEGMRSARRSEARNICLNSVKQVSIAALIYATDSDDRMPLAANWYDATAQYRENRPYVCPLDSPGHVFGFNANLHAVDSARMAVPSDVPLIFETGATGSNPTGTGFTSLAFRHGKSDPKAHIARADTSTISYSTARAKTLQWMPKLTPPPKTKPLPTKTPQARRRP
jgi:hypothetical protein